MEQTRLTRTNNESNKNTPNNDNGYVSWKDAPYRKLDEIANNGIDYGLDSFVILIHPENGEYAIMHLFDEKDNPINVTTGSKLIMEKLQKAQEAGKLPQGAKFTKTESISTGRNYFNIY